LQEIIKAIH